MRAQQTIVKRKYANIVFDKSIIIVSFVDILYSKNSAIDVHRNFIKKKKNSNICVLLTEFQHIALHSNDEHSMAKSKSVAASVSKKALFSISNKALHTSSGLLYFSVISTSLSLKRNSDLRAIVPPADDAKCATMRACALSTAVTGAKLTLTATSRGESWKLQ